MPKEKIYVSRKILADIGRGIYRTPANAIKELVSNSFDACATWIKITTNAPYFNIFTCEDNGEGMDPEEFKKILNRIGSSVKRAKGAKYIPYKKSKRPIIGKIGIGLLAVSQICDKFNIISKKKEQKEAFEATIDLLQFEKGEEYLSGEPGIALGEYEIKKISVPDEEISISYTKIIIESLKEGFHKVLKEEFKRQIIRPKSTIYKEKDFAVFVEKLSEFKDFKSVSAYDYMVWELGFLCPLEYIQNEKLIFPSDKFIGEDIKRLENYNFKLYVDGLDIHKPIFFLKRNGIKKENEDFKIYLLPEFNEIVAGELLKFHGYIYSQRVKIKPTELQGILIRIKDVAIGNYDKSILKYPREEGPIFSMVSGEIFIEEGLENALNIDRNSFNETHPHYQKLQSELHRFFIEKVVNDIRERSKQRRRREKEELTSKELTVLSENIKNKWDIKLLFDVKEQVKNQLYLFDKKENKLTFFTKTRGWAKTEKERVLQMKAIIFFTLIDHFRKEVEADRILLDIVFGEYGQ